MNDKDIIDAFYDGMPDDATLNDCADGIDITFTFDGVQYTINTYVRQARTQPIDSYYRTIEQRAVDAVRKK